MNGHHTTLQVPAPSGVEGQYGPWSKCSLGLLPLSQRSLNNNIK